MPSWDPERALDELMDRIARPCIRIHRPFPPPRTRTGRSKFGGLPTLPPGVEWPCGRSFHQTGPQATPLHFMAQVDCAELPRVGDALPTSGMLFFFANMCDGGAWYDQPPDDCRKVIYAPDVPAEQPLRMPPPDLPLIEPRADQWGLPYGYSNGHLPDDPLTGKVFFDWPMQFVAIDSYPAESAARETTEWAALAALWTARAEVDAAFMKEWGPADEGAMGTVYHDRSFDRMRDHLFRAVNIVPPGAPATRPRMRKHWRDIDAQTGGSFPPTAVFASVIATTVDAYLRRETTENRRHHQQYTRATLWVRLRKLFGLPTDPAYFKDLQVVRNEATEWLRYTRALGPDHPLDGETRERFLAWLDGLFDRNWRLTPDRQEPRLISSIAYVFDAAMHRLAQLSAADAAIRSCFPEALYETYFRSSYLGFYHHQMLGYFPSAQEPRPIDDPMVPLLTLSYDMMPGFYIGDVGEMQFFIKDYDLRDRNFAFVEVQMQGH